jgi:protein-disulfide isomerase
MKLKKLSLSVFASACLLALSGGAALAAAPAASAPAVSDALVQAVVNKLESSGALDTAVDRGVDRFVANMQKKQAQQQAEQQKRMAEAQQQLASRIAKVNLKTEHVYGPKDAEVTLVEYSDPECPFCKEFADIPENIVKKYNGKVNYVWRFFPLAMHGPKAIQESVAAECAGEQGGNAKFFSTLMTILHTTASNGQGMPGKDPIDALAKKEGLDMAKFKACMNGKEALDKVQASLQEGTKAGVSGTPTSVLINNKTGQSEVNVGYAPQPAIEALVNKLLTK